MKVTKLIELHEAINRSGRRIAGLIQGTGTTVLLIHGIPGSAGVWNRVLEDLSTNNRVIVPDLIGFGRSSRSTRIDELWAGSQADSILSLLESVGADRVHVVAHDFGGPVAAALYERIPQRFLSLTLAATNLFDDTPIPFPLSGVRWPLIGGPWARIIFSRPSLAMMLRSGTGQPKPARLDTAIYLGDRGQVGAIRTIFTTAIRELAERYGPVAAALKRCRVPATVLWGDRDPFFPAAQGERTAALLGEARFRLLEGAGHFLPEERPREMVEAVRGMSAEALGRDVG